MLVLIGSLFVFVTGCNGPTSAVRKVDTRLARYSDSARTAYTEGHVEEALEGYRKALHRAWAMDDPAESGTAAYNLAACYASLPDTSQATDWLLDARVEMCRAKVSVSNVWILESKIALRENRLADAERYLQHASRSTPDCDAERGWCVCGPADPCGDGCLTQIPGIGTRIAKKRSTQQCENDFRAQIELGRARLAAQKYETKTAKMHFERACRLVADQCNHDLQSEFQNVAAHIHLARGEFLMAASHFEHDAYHLRLAGNYHEIPGALRMASAAYEQAGYTPLAASRLGRVARILLGRGDPAQAWKVLQRASELAQVEPNESVTTGLSLTAREIELALSADSESESEAVDPRNAPLEMLTDP